MGWSSIHLCRYVFYRPDINATPYFHFIGMNSIVLYLGHYVAWQMGPFNYISGPMNTHWDNLVESIWSVSAWLIVAYVMYRKKVFITV